MLYKENASENLTYILKFKRWEILFQFTDTLT